MEAYTVWTTLNVKGDAFKKLKLFNTLLKLSKAGVESLTQAVRESKGYAYVLESGLEKARRKTDLLTASSNKLAKSFENVASRARGEGSRKAYGIPLGSSGSRSGRRIGFGGARFSSNYGSSFVAGFGLHNPAMMAGAAGAAMIYGSAKQNSTYQKRLMQFQSQGFTSNETSQVNSFVDKNRIKGISQSEILRAVVDAAMATGSVKKAFDLAPTLAKISVGNKNTFESTFNAGEEAKLIRFAESRGGSDISLVKRTLDLGEKMYAATGGRLKPHELLNFQTMATTAGYHLSDQGFLKLVPVLQELGGSRVGTGYQTMFNRLITGKGLGTASGEEGVRIGLLSPGKNGKPPTLKKEYEKILQTDLVGFIKDVWMPLLKKDGITDEMGMTKEGAIVFDRTAARVADVIIKNMSKSERMLPLHEKADDSSIFEKSLNLPSGKINTFFSAFENFEKSLGELTAPAVIGGIEALTWFFETLEKSTTSLSTFLNPNGMTKGWDASTVKGIDQRMGSRSPNLFNADVTSQWFSPSSSDTTLAVNIDGNKLGEVLIKKFNRMMSPGGSIGSTTSVDQSLTLMPPALSYSRGS